MSETDQIAPDTANEQFERCEECQAPVDRDQRYCVNCGAHRRGVTDPAAKYMSRATARPGARGALSSSPAGAALARSGRRGVSGIGLLGALALALIPVAAVVGVAIGRSSNNQDGRLIRALENQRAQVTTTLVASSGTAASSDRSSSPASSSTPATKKTAKHTGSKSKTATASSSTSNGKVTKVTGAKVTASQQAQGSNDAKKVQNSTGKNYVQADNNLPSSVVVGP